MPDSSARDEFLTEASETVDNKYSPDKFYTASRNKKGFGTTIHINVPPEVLSMVSQLVQSKAIAEYTTSAAFYRDAIVHRIKYLEDMIRDDRVPVTKTGQIMLMADRSARTLSERQGVEQSLKNYEESLRLTDGIEQRAIVRQLKEDLRTVDDSTFRERGQRILNNYDR